MKCYLFPKYQSGTNSASCTSLKEIDSKERK